MPDNPAVASTEPGPGQLGLPRGWRLPVPSPALQAGFLSVLSLIVLGLIVTVALAHLTDRHRVDHVAGSWIALTRYAEQGILYPPLFDGERFGGTRWMPLSLVYNLGFAQLGTDLMTTGKLAALTAWAAVMWSTYALLVRLEVPRSVALFLLAAIAVSEPLLLEAWAPFRGDTPALVLQLLAVLLVLRPPLSTASVAAAGALSALALLAKASAGWAPMGIGLFLLVRDRRRLAAYVASYAVIVFGGLALFQSSSEGRMLVNLTSLSTNAVGLRQLLGSAGSILYVLETEVQALWMLTPLVIAEAVWALRQGRLHLVHLVVAAAGVVSLVLFADPDVASNHLVDLLVLSALAVGLLYRRVQAQPAAKNVLLGLIACALLAGVDLGLVAPLQGLYRSSDAHSKTVYAQLAKPHHRVLSEDPAVPVVLGQDPIVLDACMWRRLADSMPQQTRTLVARVEQQEFDRIVLLEEAEMGLKNGWYVRGNFNERLIRAVLDRYRLLRTVHGFWVYEPAR